MEGVPRPGDMGTAVLSISKTQTAIRILYGIGWTRTAQRLAFNVYYLVLIRRTFNHEGHGIGLRSRCANID